MSMSIKLIPVQTWLDKIGLSEYTQIFHQYTGIELLLYIKESELRDLGVVNSAHRARMISSLSILRAKYEGKPPSSPRHSGSFSPSPPTLASHPDYAFANVSAEQLKADLEKELKMDSNDIRSHAWFHGSINRQLAEKYVQSEGDFLVRESTSQPGDYVLTCFSKGIPLHFVINKTVHQTMKYSTLLYQFESETFNSIPDLIRFYVGNRQPITAASRCVIITPINRTIPLSYYGDKMRSSSGTDLQRRKSAIYMPVHSPGGRGSQRSSPAGTPMNRSPQVERRVVHRRSGSQPILSQDGHPLLTGSQALGHHGSLPAIDQVGHHKMASVSQLLSAQTQQRTGSDPVLTPHKSPLKRDVKRAVSPAPPGDSSANLNKHTAPPKPSRVPSFVQKHRPVVEIRNKALYDDEQGDYSDYDQVKSTPKSRDYYHDDIVYDSSSNYKQNIAMATSKQDSFTEGVYDNNLNIKFTLGNDDYDTPSSNQPVTDINDQIHVVHRQHVHADSDSFTEQEYMAKSRRRTMSIPATTSLEEQSAFNISFFTSEILPPENKPLETTVMITVKTILMETSANLLAKCISKLDLELVRVVGDHDLGVEVTSGLELITLPQGQQLREDLLERYNCMKMFIAVSILTCNNVKDRACMLEKWIEVAMEMRTTMGNLFSFSAIMDTLGSTQITRLKSTWLSLRQNFTKNAFMFDSKLKNLMKSLNEGSGSLPLQNVSIPYIIPLIQLMERTSADELTHWEKNDIDLGVDIMLTHLDVARIVAEQCGLYRVKGQEIVDNFHPESRILDIFRTELHLNLLWGSKGAGVNRRDRYSKFIQLLNVLSEKVEPFNINVGTEL